MSIDADTETADRTAIVEVTPAALEKILEIRADEDEPEALQLRVEVTGARGADYTYDLAFEDRSDTTDDDVVSETGGLRVVVPSASVDQLRGSVLDLPTSPVQGGLVLRNPNRPNPLDQSGSLELEGDVADKVNQLLEQSINPSLASHGGFASLVGVDEENRVLLTMGGGCQGCAMSQATLVEGIQRAILEAIPEVTEVVDATDHASGTNPYY